MAPATTDQRRRTGVSTAASGSVSVGVIPPLGVSAASSWGISSSALCHRSAGFFSRHFITNAASAGGMLARWLMTGSAAVVMWAAITACGLAPVKGGCPVNSS